MANSMPGKSAKMKVLSTFVIASVISAYEATIINNLLNGKDIPPLSADLVGKVIGRSFGPIGDALVSGGDSVHGNILGNLIPGANFFLDVAGNTVGLGKDALTGDFKKMPARSAKILGKVMPGQTAPVFGLLFKRYINDQILAMTDPEAHRKFRGKEKQMKNTTGTQSWWKPGELTPGRAPDLSKMMSLHSQYSIHGEWCYRRLLHHVPLLCQFRGKGLSCPHLNRCRDLTNNHHTLYSYWSWNWCSWHSNLCYTSIKSIQSKDEERDSKNPDY
jgi:hypothetical protein